MMSKSYPKEADIAADPGQPIFSGQRSVTRATTFSSAQMRMAGFSCLHSLSQDFVTEMGRGLASYKKRLE